MKNKVVCFGEIMLRLSPLTMHERLAKTHALKMGFAGAESNVAVSLALLGQEAFFVTCLPSNSLGDAAENSLREFGVNTQYIRRSGDRMGTYFIEYGASIRSTQVIYDRKGSAIAQITPGILDWKNILAGKQWLHLTGITPALSIACAEECFHALKEAKDAGVKVSFDLNFRRTLWSKVEANAVFTEILPFVDLLIANAGSAYDVFDIDTGNPHSWAQQVEAAKLAGKELSKLGNFELIAMTVRNHPSASENDWAGLLYDRQHFYESKKYEFLVVERLGGGDAFTAALLHGLCEGWDNQQTIEFATAASALKHTIPGDLNIVTEAEITEAANGNLSGRVKR